MSTAVITLQLSIRLLRRKLRKLNARLVNTYHDQGMTMAEAIHQFIEEYENNASASLDRHSALPSSLG